MQGVELNHDTVIDRPVHVAWHVACRDGDGKGNVVPGTVADRGICSPKEYDFWLNSHAGRVARASMHPYTHAPMYPCIIMCAVVVIARP